MSFGVEQRNKWRDEEIEVEIKTISTFEMRCFNKKQRIFYVLNILKIKILGRNRSFSMKYSR
jgi:hypothetical protein